MKPLNIETFFQDLHGLTIDEANERLARWRAHEDPRTEKIITWVIIEVTRLKDQRWKLGEPLELSRTRDEYIAKHWKTDAVERVYERFESALTKWVPEGEGGAPDSD